jgi:hypothetical protein
MLRVCRIALIGGVMLVAGCEQRPIDVVVDSEEASLVAISNCRVERGVQYCNMTNLRRDRSYRGSDFGYEVVDANNVVLYMLTSIQN